MKSTIQLLCFVFLAGNITAAEEDLSKVPILFERGSQVAPLISIYTEGFSSGGNVSVIACIWPDGRVIWSRNRNEGGRPYFTGHIQRKQLQDLLAGIRASGIFAHKVWFGVVVDAPIEDHAYIIDGQRRVALTSTGGAYSAKSGTISKHITEVHDAMAFLYQQIEPVLPRPGQKLNSFNFELRPSK